jgi:hypothetical protein
MTSNEEADRRTRSFADVVSPAQGEAELALPRVQLSDRSAPPPRDLGPLKLLPGVWTGDGTGWNMIALPFHGAPPAPAGFKFRVLMNQYSEELRFTFVDHDVPNRGLVRPDQCEPAPSQPDPSQPDPNGPDQFVVALDYQQKIAQKVAEDQPPSPGLAGAANLPIHHEPGMWLHPRNRTFSDDNIEGDVVTEVELDVARLASIPHGNSVLALGTSRICDGMPEIPPISGLALGRFEDVRTPGYDFRSDPYLKPYKHYIKHPFKGDKGNEAGFPGFSPADMNEILRYDNRHANIVRTTTLTVDSTRKDAGISNAPFAAREAEPVSMKSTFWIQELAETDEQGNPRLRLQYSQVVMLHFFRPREDGFPGRAVWPHISIATLTKAPAPVVLTPA